MQNKRGFASIWVIVGLVAILIGGVGYFAWMGKSNQVSATIDQSSLSTESAKPTITGTVQSANGIGIFISSQPLPAVNPDPGLYSDESDHGGGVILTGGRFSDTVNTALPAGTYHVGVYSVVGNYTSNGFQGNTYTLLTAGMLTVNASTSATAIINQDSLGTKGNTGTSIVLKGNYSGTTAIMVTVTRIAHGSNLPAQLEYRFDSSSSNLQESDGRWTATLPRSDSGNGPLANDTYTVAVYDNSNGTNSINNPVLTTGTLTMVAPAHYSAELNVAPISGIAPLDVAFYSMFASSSDPINFGDGISASNWGRSGGGDVALFMPHTYTKPGTYTATLTSDNGASSVTIMVLPIPPSGTVQSATIDQASLMTNSPTPTITGSASSPSKNSEFEIFVIKGTPTLPNTLGGPATFPVGTLQTVVSENAPPGSVFVDGDSISSMWNGRWSWQIYSALQDGTYTVAVYNYGGDGRLLTNSVFTIKN